MQNRFLDWGIIVRVIVLRLLMMFFSVAVLLGFKPSDPALLVLETFVGCAVLLGSAIIYGWGGWKASKNGYSFANVAILGLVTGLFVGVCTGSSIIGAGNTTMYILHLVIEMIFAVVSMLIGAYISTKIKQNPNNRNAAPAAARQP